MSKYIIELDDNVQIITCIGVSTHGTIWVKRYDVDNLEQLNSDYINENFGELQDEAYELGYEDGKKSVEDEGLRNNINLIVTQCGYSLDEINDMIQKMRGERQ